MGFIKGEEATVSLYDLFVGLVPIIKAVIKKLKKEFVFISVWHGHKNKYIYHIDNKARDAMYGYLEDEKEVLKKIGLVFGNDRVISTWEKLYDIGIYAFLPFYEIYRNYGTKKMLVNEKICTIAEICKMVAKNIKAENKDDLKKAVFGSELLIKYVLTRLNDVNFVNLLVPANKDFAKAYISLWKDIGAKPGGYESIVMSRFVKASFRGMYISSEGFSKLALTANPSEAYEQAEQIASRIGKSPAEFVQKIEGLSVFEKLVAVFEPKVSRKKVEKELGKPPSLSFILTDKIHYARLEMLFGSFKDFIYDFDREMRASVNGKQYRIPIIVNMYRDENAKKLRSVSAAYNEEKKMPQQIRFTKSKFGNAFKRCAAIASKYSVYQEELLPSEQ